MGAVPAVVWLIPVVRSCMYGCLFQFKCQLGDRIIYAAAVANTKNGFERPPPACGS